MTQAQAANQYAQQQQQLMQELAAAQKKLDDYVSNIAAYYNKKSVQQQQHSGASKTQGTTYTQTNNTNAEWVQLNDQLGYKRNATSKYQAAIDAIQKKLDNLSLATADSGLSNFTSKEREGNVSPDKRVNASLDQRTLAAEHSLYDQAQSNQQTANANARANITAGIDRSKAGLLGAYNANESNTQIANNLYGSRLGTNAATQADYLQKMSSADALDIQADNIRKGANAATLSAGLQGFATGASSGAALAAASDERVKQSPDAEGNTQDDTELLELVKQFRGLYRRLQELKQNKQGGR